MTATIMPPGRHGCRNHVVPPPRRPPPLHAPPGRNAPMGHRSGSNRHGGPRTGAVAGPGGPRARPAGGEQGVRLLRLMLTLIALAASIAWEMVLMAALSIRNLDESVRQRLALRAARHGRSMEAEVRAILTEAVSESAD